MKITVVVPKANEKWRVSFGKGARYRRDASVIYNAVERRLQARDMKEKTSIVVKYTKDTSNETLPSLDARYLLYATGCFLEDYLKEICTTIIQI